MQTVLTINSGSSSLRFGLFQPFDPFNWLLRGKFERIGLSQAKLTYRNAGTDTDIELPVQLPEHPACLPFLLGLIEKTGGPSEIRGIGHRVVHGGPKYREPALVDAPMLTELKRITHFAPNHLPVTISLMEDFASRFPRLPQFACFDTAFHKTLPRVARMLPIPRRYEAKGVERYGFHGLSCTYLMEELERVAGATAAKGRVILAHLGNGASMTAVRDGKSLETSMGFTPTAGLMMSTRAGDLDPGLVGFMERSEQMTPGQFDQMIHHESGLLGVSETSSDIRDLLAREKSDVRAAEAISLFCYQAKKWMGMLATVLGGVETIVFSGGIGENSAVIRSRICEGLGFLGIELGEDKNGQDLSIISKANAKVMVYVLRTDEERVMARSAARLI